MADRIDSCTHDVGRVRGRLVQTVLGDGVRTGQAEQFARLADDPLVVEALERLRSEVAELVDLVPAVRVEG